MSGEHDIEPPRDLRGALGEVWSIAWPTVLTMTSFTVMQFVDKLMVGQVGPLEVAAQGNGGIWSFVPVAIASGVLTVVNTWVSQNLGAGRPEEGPKYAWASIWMSFAMWVTILLPFAMLMPWIFAWMHADPAIEDAARLIRLESDYGRILLVGSGLLLAGRGLHHWFYGMHRPKVVTVAVIAGNIVNVVVNYVLIFGEAGLPQLGLPGAPGVPAMGLYGAAIGTVLGTAVELIVPAIVFLGRKNNETYGTRRGWRPAWAPIRDLLRIGWPASVQFGSEMICWSIFMTVLVGRFGTEHMAAGWITMGYMHLSFMPAIGFNVAVNSLVGKYIGAGRPDTAVSRARLGVGLSMVYMTACALVFVVFRHPMISIFVGGDVAPDLAESIIAIGGRLLIIAALFQTVDALGIVYMGALRGAGDTVWPGAVSTVCAWVFILGGGWVLAERHPELESVGPWIAAATYCVITGIMMAWRFESGRWRSIRLLDPAARVAPIGPGPPPTDPSASSRDIVSSQEYGSGPDAD